MRQDDDKTQHAQSPAERRIGHGVLELLCALPAFAFAPLVRHWHLRWRATDAEVAAPMRGDDKKPDSTRSWLLRALPGGRTRLIVRIRAHPANLFWTLFMEFGDPPMAVRMLDGIKSRAEG
jgi:hypothetical protein